MDLSSSLRMKSIIWTAPGVQIDGKQGKVSAIATSLPHLLAAPRKGGRGIWTSEQALGRACASLRCFRHRQPS